MAVISPKDGDFRHPGLSHLDFKQLDMDRVLTAFLARLHHNGFPSRLSRGGDLGVDFFVNLITGPESPADGTKQRFRGFKKAPDITRRWVETDLVDMVNRGRTTQAVAGLRPLHGFTYKFRNSRRSRPYGADEHLYEMLDGAPGGKGTLALSRLRAFFFPDAEQTGASGAYPIDVETQTLLHLSALMESKVEDGPVTSRARRKALPFCKSQADLLADDVVRLMSYELYVPRSVMVDYLKILFAFHLALYHLRVIKALPTVLARRTIAHECALDPYPKGPAEMGLHCEFGIGLLVDARGEFGTPAARLAERSAAVWQSRIPGYVRASYTVKKLDDFADHLSRKRLLAKPPRTDFSVDTLLGLRTEKYRAEFEAFFRQRIIVLLENADNSEDGGHLPDEAAKVMELKLDDFERYIEMLTLYRGDFHRKYLNNCLDSLMLKNRPGALITQKQRTQRRFVLDSRLIEVLLQIALVRPADDGRLRTAPLRVDEFMAVLRTRYGVYIDRLPPESDGFASPSIDDHRALRDNVTAFTDRLREIGFYTDLSDAYLTQTIRPRYTIDEHAR